MILALIVVIAIGVYPNGIVVAMDVHIPATRELLTNNTEIIWKKPPQGVPIKGVMLLFHGCSHQAGDFFTRQEVTRGLGCEKCLGLPAERSIVKTLINRNYVAVAITSKNKQTKCWGDEDVSRVAGVVEHIYRALNSNTEEIPLYVLGASSGGYFTFTFTFDGFKEYGIKVAGIVCQIATITSDAITRDEFQKMKVSPIRPPPTIFNAMFRDAYTAMLNERAMRVYRTLQIPCIEYVAYPKALKDDYFVKHGDLTPTKSAHLVRVLKKTGILNEFNEVIHNPRGGKSHWRKMARYIISSEVDKLEADKSPVSQAMNIAYSEHEITSEYMTENLNWLEEVKMGQHKQLGLTIDLLYNNRRRLHSGGTRTASEDDTRHNIVDINP